MSNFELQRLKEKESRLESRLDELNTRLTITQGDRDLTANELEKVQMQILTLEEKRRVRVPAPVKMEIVL